MIRLLIRYPCSWMSISVKRLIWWILSWGFRVNFATLPPLHDTWVLWIADMPFLKVYSLSGFYYKHYLTISFMNWLYVLTSPHCTIRYHRGEFYMGVDTCLEKSEMLCFWLGYHLKNVPYWFLSIPAAILLFGLDLLVTKIVIKYEPLKLFWQKSQFQYLSPEKIAQVLK